MIDTIITVAISLIQWLFRQISIIFNIKTKPLCTNVASFTDRKIHIDTLIQEISAGIQIINIYGKKGVGKTTFLTYFCDFVNSQIPTPHKYFDKAEERQYKKLTKKYAVVYLPLKDYSTSSELLSGFGSAIGLKEEKPSVYAIAKHMNIRYLCRKKILIIFDGIKNRAQSECVELFIQEQLPLSEKFTYVIGSVEECVFVYLSNISQTKIEIPLFGEDDIYEYVKKTNNHSLNSQVLSRFLEISQGLPIFVSILYNKNTNDKDNFLLFR